MTAVGKSGTAGTKFFQEYTLPTAECNSIDVEIWDGATAAGEGLVFHGITLEHDPYEGLPRLGEAERA